MFEKEELISADSASVLQAGLAAKQWLNIFITVERKP